MLNTNGQAHHAFAHAGFFQLGAVQLAVRGRCRVCGQRFGVANVDQACEQLQGIEKACTSGTAFAIGGVEAEGQNA